MKALIENIKKTVLATAVLLWLLPIVAAKGENTFTYYWSATEVGMACGVVCPPDITIQTDPGLCTAVFNYSVTVTDPFACSSAAYQTAGLPSGSAFPTGATVNTYQVDGFPVPPPCSFTVTVQDGEPPVVVNCPADINVNTGPGVCDAEAFWALPNESDNCGVISFTFTHSPGDIFPVGVTPVTYVATDPSGNDGVCTFNIMVTDAEGPQISTCSDPPFCTLLSPGCPFPVFINNDPGLCTAVATWEEVVVLDNCPGATIMGSHVSGSTFPSGFTTVTYTATDAAGNVSSCNFDVFVDDAEPPVLTCPDITVNNDPGVCEAVVNFSPVAVDNCGIFSVDGTPSSGSVFPLGTTNVSVTAIDNTGIPGFCNFNLTVVDAEAPVINNCPTNISVNNDPSQCGAFVNWMAPTAGDNCTFANLVGSHFPPDFFPIGTTTVTYTADDAFGNTSTCIFDVTVVDNEAPILTFCPTDVTIATDFGTCTGTLTWTPPTVSDNCFTTNLTSTHNPGDVFNLGTTAVTYTATDAVGNTGNCAFNVTVQDFESPNILNCPANIVTNTDPGACTAVVNWVPPMATDNCGIASFTSGNNPGDPFPTGGTFTVIYTATDNAGLVTNCFFDVTVLDNEAPAMTGCPANINTTTSATFGICSGNVSWTDPVFIDNCGIGLSGSSHINGGFFPVGTTTVTIFASDFSGNTTNCIFDITLVDDEAPQIIPCPSNYIVDTDPGLCTAVVAWTPFTYFENCGVPTVINSHNPGDAFPVGTTTVTYTATDAGGLSSSCIFDVVVSDNENPVITGCPANISVNNAPSFCAANATWTAPMASDNCLLATFTSSHLPGAVFPVGTTAVTYTATDNAGLTAICTFNVTVNDAQNPTITGCPADITVPINTNPCSAVVNWAVPMASDNCSVSSFLANFSPGDIFPVGNTNVVYTALDAVGNSATCSFSITVQNGTATTNLIENICDGQVFSVGGQSFGTTGVFQVNLLAANGCDSIVNLDLTVLPIFQTNLIESICDGQVFNVGGQSYGTTGVFQVNLTAANGCDSIVNLNLTVLPIFQTNLVESICDGQVFNVGGQSFSMTGVFQVNLLAANGCDSIINLDLTVLPIFQTNLVESICDGQTFTVGGQSFNSTGIFQVNLMAANGCDSIVNLNLTVLPIFQTNLVESICDGQSFNVGGQSFNTTGIFQVSLTAANGCDSIVNLDLTVLPIFQTNLVESICDGQSFNVGGQSFSTTGVFQVNLTAANGCDSIVNLDLTVLPIFQTNLIESICDGQTFNVGGQSFSTTGVFQVNLLAANGCDSIVNLDLTVLPIFQTNLIESICDGQAFNVGGQSFNSTGIFQVNLTATNGCDSIVNLDLTVLPIFQTNLVESICDGQTFNVGGQSFSTTGVFQVNLMAANGCDSIVNLNLTVLPTFQTNLVESICDGQTFTVGGQNFSTTGVFQVNLTATNGCDSIVNLDLTVLPIFQTNLVESICDGQTFNVGGQSFNSTGVFQVNLLAANGCDSIVNLDLTVLPIFQTNLIESICDGQTFTVGGQSFSTTGVFQVNLLAANGCDSIVNLDLTVLPIFQTNLVESICDGQTFTVGGQSFNSTGIFQVSLTAANGCDSIVNLDLTVLPIFQTNLIESICDGHVFNVGGQSFSTTGVFQVNLTAANGCDSIVNLDLTVLPIFQTNLVESICQGQTITVGGQSFSTTGIFQVNLTAANGCDSIVNLDLTVLPIFQTNLVESICDGQTFTVGGQSFSTTGIFQVNLLAANGCDSIVNLDLTVLPIFQTNLVESICDGQVFNVGGQSFSTTGIYQVNLVAANGCDSIVNLNLTVLPILQTNLVESICDGQVFNVGGQSFSSTGVFQVNLLAANGCDSIVNLDLTVLPIFQTNLVESICDGQVFNVGGQSFSTTGVFQVNLTAANGCDSIVNLDLTVLPIFQTNLVESICDGQTFNVGGQSFSTTGVFQVNLAAANGCDSIVNLNLTVLPIFQTNLVESICNGQTFNVGGQNFSTTGVFQVNLTATNGCDSIVNLDLTVLPIFQTNLIESICDGQTFTVGGQSFSTTGVFQVNLLAANGCDSIVNLDLTVLPIFQTNLVESICDGQVFNVGGQSFSTTGAFQVNLTAGNGCDSIVNLDLTVLPIFQTNLIESICDGQAFNVGGQSFNSTGIFQVNLTATNGCDSIVNLDLTVLPIFQTNLVESICDGQTFNVGGQSFSTTGVFQVNLTAANGCDSIVNLDLAVLPIFQTNLVESICDGQTFTVGGQSFSTTGIFQVNLTATNGCDSIVNLDLTVLPIFQTNLIESICDGQTFNVGGQSFSTTGIFQVNLTAANGCDSIVNLNLTVLPIFQTNLIESICDGQTFTVGGQSFNTTGIFQVNLLAANGCDSIVNLNLTVLPIFQTNLIESICDGQTFTVGGQSFNSTGVFQVNLMAANGCDSIVNLKLTVLPIFQTNLVESICDGQVFNVGGQSFNSTGIFQVNLTAANGCDSIVNLDLTVLPIFQANLVESICDGQVFNVGGQSFSTTGNFQVNLTFANGCDSIVNLDLTVLPIFQTNLVESICDGQSFTVGGQSFNSTGVFQVNLTAANGCDSIVNLNLTVLTVLQTNLTISICQNESYQVGNQVFAQTGFYEVILPALGGCDSIISLDLTVNDQLFATASASVCEGDSLFLGGAFQTQSGIYFDTLTAAGGCDSIVQTELAVFQNPTVNIMGPTTICLGFSALLSAGAFQNYLWSPGGETFPTVSVSAPGVYSVTVQDQNGCLATDDLTLELENCSMVSAGFSVSQDTACASHLVQFTNQSSTNATSLLWSFGNGSFSQSPNPYTVYPFPGNYTVRLIASDGVTSDTSEQQVFVYPKIQAGFSSLVTDVCQPKSLIFNDMSQGTFGLTGWLWNFGDGSDGSGANPAHTYTNFDTVNVTHIVFDKFGCTDSINQDVEVADLGFVPAPVHLCLNLCEGDSLVVENEVFNAANPVGSATLPAASGCDSLVTVELTFSPLATFSLGADISICENQNTTLDAGAGNTFLWSTGETAQSITVGQSGIYTVTVADGTGCPEVGNIQVLTDTIPNETALAGADKSVCETTEITALAAIAPQFSTGNWTTFGNAEINNTGNPASTVSNLPTGQTLFVWTLTNGACQAFSADTMAVNVTAIATEPAQAGNDLSFCNSVPAIALNAVGTQATGVMGEWSQPASQASLGIEILEPTNPNSPISGFIPNNSYLFTWTLTNGVCGAYSIDNVLVSTYSGLLPPADAGDEVNLCDGLETQLSGNLPPGTTGEWTTVEDSSAAFIAQPFEPSTLVSDLVPGGNAFAWTLSSSECPAYSSDTVLVFQSEGLAANADVYFNLGQPLTNLDFLANDDIPGRENVTLNFLTTPLYGSLKSNGDGTYDFTFGVDTTENIDFSYEICLKSCPDVCSQANVVILSKTPLVAAPPIEKPANVMTPNGDGTGEMLLIPNFGDIPPPIELVVVNRWGNLVFKEKNYQNNWNGKNQNGKELPDGTYYYILTGAGSEVSGAVTIVR